jgi:D-glycero-beta-D-manno-heptose-7-phosphate kinase
LVIGDSMIDSYIWGKVERISPEAPVPVISNLKRERRLGGAANVALNILAMGAKPIICSVIGNDINGAYLKELLVEHQLETSGIFIEENRLTTTKTRIISNHHHLLRVDEENTHPISFDIQQRIINYSKELISNKKVNAIIFEDYDKGLITKELIQQIIDCANAFDLPVLVDPKKNNFFNYQGATLFKPNFKEFTEGLKTEIKQTDFNGIGALAAAFLKEYHIKYLLVTLAEHGMLLCNETEFLHIPAVEKLDISDVSGAGDTVISVTALGTAAKINFNDTAFFANLAGGLVCEKPGVVPITAPELLQAINKRI